MPNKVKKDLAKRRQNLLHLVLELREVEVLILRCQGALLPAEALEELQVALALIVSFESWDVLKGLRHGIDQSET